MAAADIGERQTGLTSFRPYSEEFLPPPAPRIKVNSKSTEFNPPAKKAPLQKPYSSNTSSDIVPPPNTANVKKKIQPTKASAAISLQTSTTSLSGVSALGSTANNGTSASMSHRSIVEEQIDKIMSSNRASNSLPENLEDHWMPDKLCHECSECGIRFTLFVRRHHCRVCGRIYCHSCSNHTIPGHLFRANLSGNIRVCLACERIFYEVVTTQRNQDATPSIPPSPPPPSWSLLTSDTPPPPPPSHDIETSSITSTNTITSSIIQNRLSFDENEVDLINSPSRANTMGIEFDNPTLRRHTTVRKSSLPVESEENILALAEDEVEFRLQEIWHKFLDKTTGLCPTTHRYRFRNFPNSYSAHEIVDWLIHSKMARSRLMAVRIGQALLHTKCLKIVSGNDQQFKDSKDIIIEVGEAGHFTVLSNSPTVADAPNWFLINDEDDKIPTTTTTTAGRPLSRSSDDFNTRASLHEANVNPETGLATFHRKHLSELYPKTPSISEEISQNTPEIICEEEDLGTPKEETSETSDVTSVDKDVIKSIAPSQYIVPPTSSIAPSIGNDAQQSVSSYSILDTGAVNAALSVTGLSQASKASQQFEESTVCNEIRRQHILDHQKHLDAFLIQQLKTVGLSLKWLDTIKPLILTATHTVSTNVTPEDFMDICVYSKVKKIPGGRMSSCSFIHGVVFTKHVTHKKMDMSLRNPRILLLKCAFEFQRKENQLSSFDTLLSQEQEYLKNLVERVKRFRPSIIFVQKSVSRFALEILHNCGVVVVVNIKPSVIARIARSTQADLVTNLDQLFFDIKLGTCGRFYVRTYTLPDATRKTLIYLDECEPKLGGVILLQGGARNVLKRVKKVVLFGIQVAYNMKLESSYLADMFVEPSCMRLEEPGEEYYATPPATPPLTLYQFSPSLLHEKLKQSKDDIERREEEERGEEEEGERGEEGEKEKGIPIDEINTLIIDNKDEEEEEEEASAHREIVKDESNKLLLPIKSEEVFQSFLSSHIISMSPYMTFTSPYLQTEAGIKAHIRCYLPSTIYLSYWFQPSSLLYTSPLTHKRKDSTNNNNYNNYNNNIPTPHSYKSISNHPFTQSSFLLPVNSKETSKTNYKAALADFRARSCLPDEPDVFFFPSAKKSANVYQRLHDIFADSRDFEIKAGNLINDTETNGNCQLQIEEIDYDAKKAELARNYSTPLTPPTRQGELMGQDDIDLLNSIATPPVGFTHILEQIQSPDGRNTGNSTGNDKDPSNRGGTQSADWSFLMDENILPSSEQLDCLDPYNHQFLSLVFSSTCNDTQSQRQLYPCVLPCIIPMNYYGRNDIPLGEFLHRYCFRDAYICQSCSIDMDKHQRHFVHGRQEVRISMQQLAVPIPGGDMDIFTWSTCMECSHSTPLLPLSKDSLLYSFAKFLELKFYGSSYKVFNFEEEGSTLCCHPINTDFIQYFCYGTKVAVFELLPSDIFEVRIPPQQVSAPDTIQWHHNYPGEIKRLGHIIEGVFYRIIQYIKLFNVDPIVHVKVQDCLARAQAMRESYRDRVKKLKEFCSSYGLFPALEGRERSYSTVCGSVFMLHDRVADLKRMIAEAVFCFNIELEEIDSSVREVLTRRDGSTPLPPSEDHTPLASPHTSPSSKRKSIERSSNKSSPLAIKKKTLTPPSWLSQSTDYEALEKRKKTHKRQFSDSIALPISASINDVGGEGGNRHVIHDDMLVPRRYSDGIKHSRSGDVYMEHESIDSSSEIPSITTTTEEGEGEAMTGLGSISTGSMEKYSLGEDLVSMLQTDEIDLLAKLRSKETDDFYQIRSFNYNKSGSSKNTTGLSVDLSESEYSSSSGVSSGSSKGPPIKRYLSNNKPDEPDSGVKSTEKKNYQDPLFAKPFHKLPSPFDLTEHHLIRGNLRFHVSVYENEPTSIIAFSLCSREYANELKYLVDERKKGMTESTVLMTPTVGTSEGDLLSASTSTVASTTAKPSGLKHIKNVFSDWYKSRHNALPTTTTGPSPLQTSTSISGDDQLPSLDAFGDTENELFASIKWNSTPDSSNSSSKFSSSHENRHISLEFADETAKFFCKVYYAEEFRKLREYVYPEGEERFIRSLARCVKYEAKGGKSRAMFLKTFEDRLIMKQVQMVEITSFIETALQYFQHVSEAIKNERPLVLAKILGAYSIGFRNNKTGRSKRHHVIIMENLLYGHHCTKVFDLKGSMRGRYVTQNPKRPEVTGEVLMDENFLEYIYNSPVYVWPHSKAVLMQAILADTQFLATNSIMDYSLLTGLDEENGELVVGIIDFVRPFTLDKLLEMFIKKAGRSVLPTVVYPELYRKRFIEAMDRYFTPVPDKWTGLGADIKITMPPSV